MERLIKGLSTIIGSSSAMRSSAPDQLLGTVLEEVLKATDGAVLGWICLARGLPDHLNWPTVTALPQDSVYLAAARHTSNETPITTLVACPDCPCGRFLTGADPPPKYTVIDHCPHPILSEPCAGTHVCVPLFAKDRPIGVLNLAKPGSASFSTIEQLFLQAVASQLGAALENASLISETQARLKETQTLLTERKQLEQQLLRTERLRALGEMASGVAHNFNNVLGAILGRAQILRRAVQEAEAQRGLEAIEKAALDGANMVRRLQRFTHQGREEEFFPVDLNQVVKDVLAITEAKWKDEAHLAGTTIEIATSYGKTSPVMGNISELREVLTNLIFNAVEAMPHGGTLTLKTEEVGGWVCASVSDTGIGMTDDVQTRIFDPFFTTKGTKGTGLGLNVSYGIISEHHGEISVQSQPGQGTTVLMKLPIASGLRSTPQTTPTPSSRQGRILVIDDDEMIHELLSELLRAAGHTVVQAGGGREGLRLFQHGSFDLVLTDLGMPECTGWEVASAIKAMAPRTPVVLITGWALTLDREKLKESGIDLVLNKPFQVTDVMALVAEALELREKIEQSADRAHPARS
ncbi:MAG: response regulator [candidate division NC10 bacterium]|nr:response regulator [candidate division NC10 bacterium]